MPFDLANSLASLPENRRREVSQKLEMVYAAQRRLGMEPRNDSQLTWNYATDVLDDDVPSAIANELLIVDRIFAMTPYSRIVEYVLRGIAQHVKYKYRLSWTDAWEITRFYGPLMTKLYCFKKVGSTSVA